MSAFFENERHLARLIREDWQANFRDWTLPGFRALAVHRFGSWVQHIRWAPVRVPLRRVYTVMFRYVRNHYGIELPVTTTVGHRVVIGHQNGIVIHGDAVLGDDCFIRQNVTVGNNWLSDGAPKLGRGVSLGPGAVVVGDITIGDRARIGPNAVVMIDVAADTAVFASTPRTLKLVKSPVPNTQESDSRLVGQDP